MSKLFGKIPTPEEKRSEKQARAGCLVILGGAVLLWLVGSLLPEKERVIESSPTELTPAQVLAAQSLTASTEECEAILTRLEIKCFESKESIVGSSLIAKKILARSQIEVSLAEIVEGLDEVIPAGGGESFKRHCAGYVALRDQGWSHEQACSRVSAFLLLAPK